MKTHLRPLLMAARLVSAALIVAFIYFGQVVLIPLALALLVAFGLQPAVKRLQHWRFPRTLAVIFTCTGFLAVLAGLTWLIGGQLAAFSEDLPSYQKNIVAKVNQARAAMRGGAIEKLQTTLDSVQKEVKETEEPAAEGAAAQKVSQIDEAEPIPVVLSTRSGWLDATAFASFSFLLEPLSTLGLVALLVVMMLLQWSSLRSRLLAFLSENLTGTTHALNDAAARIGKYLGLQFAYNVSFGIIAGTALWLMGVPYAALWGLCAALFRYVPYAGPLAAAALPVLVSVVTSDGWAQVAAVAGLFVALELVSNNLIEPWLYGSNLGVSEIGIVLATVAWTFLWGPAGLVLATPLTVCLVVLGTHVPCLSFFARLLGDRSLLAVHHQLYERLVARDSVEVREIALKAKEGDFGESCAVPALALARQERLRGHLRDDHASSFREQLEKLYPATEGNESGGALASRAPVPLVLWPACPFTEAALPWLQILLQGLPADITIVRPRDFSGEHIKSLVSAGQPGVVCLVHLHADDFPRVLGMAKRLRNQVPGITLIVARWDGGTFSLDDQQRVMAAGASEVASTLEEARSKIAARVNHLANPV